MQQVMAEIRHTLLPVVIVYRTKKGENFHFYNLACNAEDETKKNDLNSDR